MTFRKRTMGLANLLLTIFFLSSVPQLLTQEISQPPIPAQAIPPTPTPAPPYTPPQNLNPLPTGQPPVGQLPLTQQPPTGVQPPMNGQMPLPSQTPQPAPPAAPLPPPRKLHIVMHSHDDVGWLATVEGYYRGNQGGVFPQYACVKCTLDEAFKALTAKKQNIFNQVEMEFLSWWLRDQNDTIKEKVKELVKNNQLYILNGGFVMNDEGCAYYEDIIDQFALGHHFVYETFGVIPKVGWHIDPFGHSAGMASIFGQMGYDGWFVERIDYLDMEDRTRTKEMETIMRPRTKAPLLNQQFVHINAIKYHGWPLDQMCTGPNGCRGGPWDYVAEQFNSKVNEISNWYKHPIGFHHIGDDFEIYGPSHFQAVEDMMGIMNKKFNVNATFSTPQMYLDDVYKYKRENKLKFSIKGDDFFPYADGNMAYWTGYFTSRPFLKYEIREAGRLLRIARKFIAMESMHSLARHNKSDDFQGAWDGIFPLAEAVAINQHHDAVTGTAKVFVNNDYLLWIQKGRKALKDYLSNVFEKMRKETSSSTVTPPVQQPTPQTPGTQGAPQTPLTVTPQPTPPEKQPIQCLFTPNHDFKLGECAELFDSFDRAQTKEEKFRIGVFNPRETDTSLIRFPAPEVNVTVTDLTNKKPINSYLICRGYQEDLKFQHFNERYGKKAPCEVIFNLNMQGHATVELEFTLTPGANVTKAEKKSFEKDMKKHVFQVNSMTALTVHKDFKKYTLKTFNPDAEDRKDMWEEQKFNLTYKAYTSTSGGVSSGDYLLRTTSENAVDFQTVSEAYYYETDDFIIIEIVATHMITQLVLDRHDLVSNKGIHVRTLIETLSQQVEVVLSVWAKDFDNEGLFWTDQNGLEMIRRINNYRKIKSILISEPIGGNFYPMYSAAYLNDESSNNRMLIMNDRSQGVASLKEGELQVMLQRHCISDDGRGVGEVHFDPQPIYTHHYLFFGNNKHLSKIQRQKQMEIEQPFLLMVVDPTFNGSIVHRADNLPKPDKTAMTRSYPSVKTSMELGKDTRTLVFKMQNMDPDVAVELPIISEVNRGAFLEYLFGDSYKILGNSFTEKTVTGVEKLDDMIKRRKFWSCHYDNEEICRRELVAESFFNPVSNATDKVIKIQPLQTRVYEIQIQHIEVVKPIGSNRKSDGRLIAPHKPHCASVASGWTLSVLSSIVAFIAVTFLMQ